MNIKDEMRNRLNLENWKMRSFRTTKFYTITKYDIICLSLAFYFLCLEWKEWNKQTKFLDYFGDYWRVIFSNCIHIFYSTSSLCFPVSTFSIADNVNFYLIIFVNKKCDFFKYCFSVIVYCIMTLYYILCTLYRVVSSLLLI